MREELFARTITYRKLLQLYPGIHMCISGKRLVFLVHKVHSTTSEIINVLKESVWLKGWLDRLTEKVPLEHRTVKPCLDSVS